MIQDGGLPSVPLAGRRGHAASLCCRTRRYAGVAGINASGTVVGFNGVHVVGRRARIRPLAGRHGHRPEPSLGGKPTAINDSGALAISGTTLHGPAVRRLDWRHYQRGGCAGPGPGSGTTAALDLNNAGQVCGWFIDRAVGRYRSRLPLATGRRRHAVAGISPRCSPEQRRRAQQPRPRGRTGLPRVRLPLPPSSGAMAP